MRRLEDLLKERIEVGFFFNTHGLKGELRLKPLTNDDSIIYNLKEILLYSQKDRKFLFATVVSVRKNKDIFLIKLKGIEHINDAEKLKGFTVYIKKSELPKLEEDEYYFYELLESEVYYENGEYVGKVEEIIETGANDVIVVRKHLNEFETQETLIPMVKNYIKDFDKENKKIIAQKLEYMSNEKPDKD